jgi:hypothetical protein
MSKHVGSYRWTLNQEAPFEPVCEPTLRVRNVNALSRIAKPNSDLGMPTDTHTLWRTRRTRRMIIIHIVFCVVTCAAMEALCPLCWLLFSTANQCLQFAAEIKCTSKLSNAAEYNTSHVYNNQLQLEVFM